MSSKTSKTDTFDVRMLVVIDSLDETDAKAVQQDLLTFCPDLSFSPVREQASLKHALEFHASGTCTQAEKKRMLKELDNDFDEDDGLYYAYAFNTKMWNPKVYYLQMEF